MRKIIFSLIFVFSLVFLSYFTLAFSFNSQPNNLYNLGDSVNASINIDQGGNFLSSLICNSITENPDVKSFTNFSLSDINSPIQISINLTPNLITGTSTSCYLEATLNGLTISSNPFNVSNLVNVTISSNDTEFKPGDQISIQGTAVKENGQNLNGTVNMNIIGSGNNSIYQVSNIVTNGYFSFNFSLLAGTAAGQYLVLINAYETDSSGTVTNTGYSNFNILIDQVPTSLNLVPLNNIQNIMPGQGYNVKAILYDQTGQIMNSPVNFTINETNGGVMNQQVSTNQFIEIPVSYNDAPGTWTIFANSDNLNSQLSFGVLENKNITIAILNSTLLITNEGNVPYTDPVTVNLGNQSIVFNISLGVGQSQKYVLSAPDGNYPIEVSSLGNDLYTGSLFLTGNTVNVQQASTGVISFMQYPLVWIVILIILVVFILFLLKKLSKKKFRGKVNLNRSFKLRDGIVISDGKDEGSNRDRFVNSRNVAELSLSLQGPKHGSTIVCLGIRNFAEIRSGKGGISETMNRIKSIADEFKAAVYENGSNVFLIFSPLKTRSQNNDLAAIQAAEQMQRVLQDHNRLLKQKIDFGISVHYGMIVAKLGVSGMKFMTLGNVISTAKKLAAISRGQVFISKDVKDRIATDIKTEMHSSGDLNYYTLLEIRDREKSQKFIKDFMNKMEREEKEKKS